MIILNVENGGEEMYKKISKFLASHPWYNSTIHALAGVGVGILITYPLVGTHPVRWGLALLGMGVLGHLYPLVAGKK